MCHCEEIAHNSLLFVCPTDRGPESTPRSLVSQPKSWATARRKKSHCGCNFEIIRRLWGVGKVSISYGYFHHNNECARPFSLYAGSVLCEHIIAEYPVISLLAFQFRKKGTEIDTFSLAFTSLQLVCACRGCKVESIYSTK